MWDLIKKMFPIFVVCEHKKDEIYKRKVRLIKKRIYEWYLNEGYSPHRADILAKKAVIDAIKTERINEIYTTHKDFLRG